MTKVFSLGGSLVAPNAVDIQFLRHFKQLVLNYLNQNEQNRLILVIGGGSPARVYQNALQELVPSISNDEKDWVGIAATKLNAELVKRLFGSLAPNPVADNPETALFDKGRILVASGWKPGFSSDYDAVVLAGRFGAKVMVNLSNIEYVYSADPKKDSTAKPIEKMDWQQLCAMVGDRWIPGSNLPFDPIAAKLAKEGNLTVVVAKGTDLANVEAILNDKAFKGTTISN